MLTAHSSFILLLDQAFDMNIKYCFWVFWLVYSLVTFSFQNRGLMRIMQLGVKQFHVTPALFSATSLKQY
jgi:hypothetical protein